MLTNFKKRNWAGNRLGIFKSGKLCELSINQLHIKSFIVIISHASLNFSRVLLSLVSREEEAAEIQANRTLKHICLAG